MSRKTLLLILGLGILALILIYVAITPKGKNNVAMGPTPTPFAQTSLKLVLVHDTTTATPSTVNVVADTKIDKIIGVQFTLEYDPKVLTNVDIQPGSFIQSPVVLEKKIDIAKGKVYYAIAISPSGKPAQGVGTVATFTFHIINSSSNLTSISFADKTLVAGLGQRKSVLQTRQGIFFSPVTKNSK